jgi:hypothetical protein
VVITSWVAHDNESWFLILLSVLIGQSTWSPFSTEVVGLGIGGVLQDGSLSISSVGDNKDILWVVDGSNNSCGNHEFFPGLGKVHVVNAFLVSSINVWLHLGGAVVGTDVASSGKHESEIFISAL